MAKCVHQLEPQLCVLCTPPAPSVSGPAAEELASTELFVMSQPRRPRLLLTGVSLMALFVALVGGLILASKDRGPDHSVAALLAPFDSGAELGDRLASADMGRDLPRVCIEVRRGTKRVRDTLRGLIRQGRGLTAGVQHNGIHARFLGAGLTGDGYKALREVLGSVAYNAWTRAGGSVPDEQRSVLGTVLGRRCAPNLRDEAQDLIGRLHSTFGAFLPEPPRTPTFPPKGFIRLADIAFRWLRPSEVDCSYGERCWGWMVISEGGCPGGLFVTLQLETKGGTIVGDVIDTLSALPAHRYARLVFEAFEGERARIGSVECF